MQMMLEIRKDLAPFYLTTLLAQSCFLSSITFFLMVNGRRVGWPMPGLDCPPGPGQPDQGFCSEAQVGLPQGGRNSQKRRTHGNPSMAHDTVFYIPSSVSIFSVGQRKTLALFYTGNHCSPAKILQSHKNNSREEGKKNMQAFPLLFSPIARATFQIDKS